MAKTRLSKFKFISRPVKRIVQLPTFLEGNFGKAVLEEYKGRAESDYDNASTLDVLKYEHGVVKSSNSFAVVLINQIIKPEGLRTATPADLEKILKTNALDLKDFFVDSALVLNYGKGSNESLEEDLINQIKSRQNIKYPVMIPLAGLELTKNQGKFGLSFKLTDETEIIYAPILNKSGHFSSDDIDKKTGLPEKTSEGKPGEGDRTLHGIDSGLSGLVLGRYLGLNSVNDALADSGSGGRVVVVSAEGA